MFALIMAGGSGSRLWPVSRKSAPKQLLGLIGKKTLLQNTFARIRKGFSPSRIYISTNTAFAPSIKKQIPAIPASHYILEPVARDIGPALGLAALTLYKKNKNASIVTAWSDHYIQNEQGFHRTLKAAEKLLSSHPDKLVLIGALAQYGHTGFRYIELGKPLTGKIPNAFAVKRFADKPDAELAQKYYQSGNFLWNTGYFVFKAAALLELYKKHLPDLYKKLMEIYPTIGTKKEQQAIDALYPALPKHDFEKDILIKLKNSFVAVTAEFDWIDIGSWRTVKDILSQPEQNLAQGRVETVNSKGNLIYNYEDRRLVAAVGMKNTIIINTEDSLLVMDKTSSEELKQLLYKLEESDDLKKYL